MREEYRNFAIVYGYDEERDELRKRVDVFWDGYDMSRPAKFKRLYPQEKMCREFEEKLYRELKLELRFNMWSPNIDNLLGTLLSSDQIAYTHMSNFICCASQVFGWQRSTFYRAGIPDVLLRALHNIFKSRVPTAMYALHAVYPALVNTRVCPIVPNVVDSHYFENHVFGMFARESARILTHFNNSREI